MELPKMISVLYRKYVCNNSSINSLICIPKELAYFPTKFRTKSQIRDIFCYTFFTNNFYKSKHFFMWSRLLHFTFYKYPIKLVRKYFKHIPNSINCNILITLYYFDVVPYDFIVWWMTEILFRFNLKTVYKIFVNTFLKVYFNIFDKNSVIVMIAKRLIIFYLCCWFWCYLFILIA